MKKELWKVERNGNSILLITTCESFGREYRDYIYRATKRHARWIFGWHKVFNGPSYGTVKIPINATEEQVRDLYSSVLSDVQAEKKRFGRVKSALGGVNKPPEIVRLAKVKDIRPLK